MRPPCVPESVLVDLWRSCALDQATLTTREGISIEVVYPGRWNTDSGPDFIGAVVRAGEGSDTRGDIELHRRDVDWSGHGHHRDPAYNNVVLHVVWQGSRPAALECGGSAPTLEVAAGLRTQSGAGASRARLGGRWEPCSAAVEILGEQHLIGILDEAGEVRFLQHAGEFAATMVRDGAQQALHAGILGTMGYSKNRRPFEELARRVTYAEISEVCAGLRPGEAVSWLEGRLLDESGLRDRPRRLLAHRKVGPPTIQAPMSRSAWRLFRVRPSNHPVRRIRGAARILAAAIASGGLLEHVLGVVEEGASDGSDLWRAFTVAGEDAESGRLVARGRAQDIVTNVVLPFVHAWATSEGDPMRANRALSLYRHQPGAPDNTITRDLGGLLFGSPSGSHAMSARRQQGLIHLAKTYCHRGDCETCPLYLALSAE